MQNPMCGNPWRWEELASELIDMLDDGLVMDYCKTVMCNKHQLSARQWRAVVREMEKE